MHEVLQGLLIAGATVWAIALLAALWARHRLRRQLRIVPGVRATVPTVWLASPTAAARFHRRLRRLAATARAAAALDPALAPLADDVVRDALALEPAVVVLRGTGRSGGSIRHDVAVRITDLEAVAWRLSRAAASSPATGGSTVPTRDRLAALEAAREELADIDLRAGLLRHS